MFFSLRRSPFLTKRRLDLMPKSSARRFTLIYFSGCPNVEAARNALLEMNEPFDEINQDQLSPGDPLLKYTSPTVLLNGDIIFGASTDGESRGCSAEKVDIRALLEVIGRKA